MRVLTDDLANKIRDRFALAKPPLRKAYLENLDNEPEENDRILYFSPLIRSHVEKADQVHHFFRQLAKMEPDEEKGINSVLDAFDRLIGNDGNASAEHPDLLFYALEFFVTQDIHPGM